MPRKATKKRTVAKKKTVKRKVGARAKKTTARKTTAKRKTVKASAKRRTTARKTTRKTTARRKTAARKSTARRTTRKRSAPVKTIGRKQTKSQVLQYVADETELSRKDIAAVFQSLASCIKGHMKKGGSGELALPECGIKVVRKRKPATKKRKMISPFTGEEITVKAKPARNVVKLTALKALKEAVNG